MTEKGCGIDQSWKGLWINNSSINAEERIIQNTSFQLVAYSQPDDEKSGYIIGDYAKYLMAITSKGTAS